MALKDPTTGNLFFWFCLSPHYLATTCPNVTPQVRAALLQVRHQTHHIMFGQAGGNQQFQRTSSGNQQVNMVTSADLAPNADAAISQAKNA